MPVTNISANELKKMISRGGVEIIDVRTKPEFAIINIKGSKSIPLDELEGRVNEINWDKDVVFLCRSGSRSRLMALLMADKDIMNLEFGIYDCFRKTDRSDRQNLNVDEEQVKNYF